MKLHPWDECVERVEGLPPSWHFHQQWNCAHCGAKQTMPDMDIWFERGVCEECGKSTDIKKNGMNYAIMVRRR